MIDLMTQVKGGFGEAGAMRPVIVKVVGNPYVLSSGYINAGDLLKDVLSNHGFQLVNLAATVGWLSSSSYTLTLNVYNEYSDNDVVTSLYSTLSPYFDNPQITVLTPSVRYSDPNKSDGGSTWDGVVKSLAGGFGQGFGTTSGISIPLAIGAVLIFGVLYFNKK